ncbi:MAG: hypothetical protein U1C52_01220 [Patescibacteria group bacterium]|nr:hypothetical protein [Patescibacteria group bacterium]
MAYLVWLSPFFNIRAVEAEGEDTVANLSLEEAIGQNIIFWKLRLDSGEIPQVTSFEVHKNYITREVRVVFNERERYAIWCAEVQGECFWIDGEGLAFAPAPNLKGPVIFKLVRDYSERDLRLGDRVLEDNLLVNLKASFVFLEELDILVQEFSIENLKFREATAHTSGGPQIYFSLQDDPAFGRAVVDSLHQGGDWGIISYIDLRVPGRAYYSQ